MAGARWVFDFLAKPMSANLTLCLNSRTFARLGGRRCPIRTWFELASCLDAHSIKAYFGCGPNEYLSPTFYREKNAFETLQDWECEQLKIPPVPEEELPNILQKSD